MSETIREHEADAQGHCKHCGAWALTAATTCSARASAASAERPEPARRQFAVEDWDTIAGRIAELRQERDAALNTPEGTAITPQMSWAEQIDAIGQIMMEAAAPEGEPTASAMSWAERSAAIQRMSSTAEARSRAAAVPTHLVRMLYENPDAVTDGGHPFPAVTAKERNLRVTDEMIRRAVALALPDLDCDDCCA